MISPQVSLGKKCKIDKHSFVGARPLRKIRNLKSVIGDRAITLYGSIIYLGTRIGDGLLIGHNSVIREENVIGDNFILGANSIIDYGCKIGDNVKVHSNAYIAQFTIIEDNVFIAPGVIIANDLHPGCGFYKKCLKGPTIKKGAQIGCNATILPSIKIGRNSIIGAGSVVVSDVPDDKVVCGNPARVLKSIYEIECLINKGKKYKESG